MSSEQPSKAAQGTYWNQQLDDAVSRAIRNSGSSKTGIEDVVSDLKAATEVWRKAHVKALGEREEAKAELERVNAQRDGLMDACKRAQNWLGRSELPRNLDEAQRLQAAIAAAEGRAS